MHNICHKNTIFFVLILSVDEALIVCCCNDFVYCCNLVFFVLSFKFSEKYKKGKEKNKITINSIKIFFIFWLLEVAKILWFCIRFFLSISLFIHLFQDLFLLRLPYLTFPRCLRQWLTRWKVQILIRMFIVFIFCKILNIRGKIW
jgi:hypothetical protein